jgi:hypothetical protein
MPINDETRQPEEVAEEVAGIISGQIYSNEEEAGDEPTFLLKRQLIDSLQTNSAQRRMYARRTFWLTCIWITLVIIIVALNGLDVYFNGIKHRVLILSDTVVVTLITTTTLNVFGFFLLVMKYLFNTEELKEMKDIFIKK